MIHRVSENGRGRFVISSHDVWLPGAYESERAARYAFRFSNSELQVLQDQANNREPGSKGGTVTFSDLQKFARERKARPSK